MKKQVQNTITWKNKYLKYFILLNIFLFISFTQLLGQRNHDIQRVTQPIQIMVDGQIYYLGEIKYEGRQFLAVTNKQDQIINNKALLKKVFFVQHVYRIAYTSTRESNRIGQLDRAVEELQEMINMSYLTDAVLFIREIASRALSEVIIAASTGGTSIGKIVVKTSGKAIAKSVATSTVKGILKDPLIYLKGVNYLTMHKALESLQRAKKGILTNMRSDYLRYEDAVMVERDIKFGLSRNTPTRIFQAQLYLQQGGGGDIISQIQKIKNYMGDQLLGEIMADFKYNNHVKINELGYKVSESIIDACHSYAKYNRDIKIAERDYGYATSQYYKEVIRPSIDHIIKMSALYASDVDRNKRTEDSMFGPDGEFTGNRPVYILCIDATKSSIDAQNKVKDLQSKGYKAGYLWIPNYKSLSGAKYYEVFIGPYLTQQSCEYATEKYRKTNPNAYGLLVSQENKRLEIRGIDKVRITYYSANNDFHSQTTGTFTDKRDGQTYKWIKIGNQIWMAENLNYNTGNSWCYDNNSSNCKKYGRLYDWQTAKRACPEGWHLPSKSEFETLLNNVGGKGSNAYYALKAGGSSGFSALFGGWRGNVRNYLSIGKSVHFWSSSQKDYTNAWYLNVYRKDGRADVYRDYLVLGFSVRCLQD